MNAKQHLTALNGYKSRAAAIESDGRFTNAGKQPLIIALMAEMDAQINRLATDLQKEFDATRAAFANIEAAKSKARAEYEAGWDFARLQYTRDQITSQVRAARDENEITQAYKDAQGDNYKIRVWGEIGADLVSGKPFAEMIGGLAGQMKRAAASLSNTPAMLKAQQSEAELAQKAFDLRADALEIVGTLNELNRGFQSYKVQEIASQIRVKSGAEVGNYVLSFAGID
jgi:hypothetical protein